MELQRALLDLLAPELRRSFRARRYSDVLSFIALLKRSVSTVAACQSTLEVQGVDATAFLTAVTLLMSYRRHLASGGPVSCKRKDVLKLTLEEYRQSADYIEKGLVDAARLLAREKVFDTRTLPYMTQLIPLSAICAVLDARFEQDPVKQKLARWFWCGVFGELYGGANETRYALDLPDVMGWIDGGDEPRTIRDASFNSTRLLSLQSRLSAAYKGLMALLMQVGSRDFLSGDPIELTSYFDLGLTSTTSSPESIVRSRDSHDHSGIASSTKHRSLRKPIE